MEFTADLETDLGTLVREHGLISVLESLKQLVEAKAKKLDTQGEESQEQAEAFKDVARALTVLVKALPPELDYEIALEQVTHTSVDLQPTEDELTSGQFS